MPPPFFRSLCWNLQWRILSADAVDWIVTSPLAAKPIDHFRTKYSVPDEAWASNLLAHSPFVKRTSDFYAWISWWEDGHNAVLPLRWLGNATVAGDRTFKLITDAAKSTGVAGEATPAFFARKFELPGRPPSSSFFAPLMHLYEQATSIDARDVRAGNSSRNLMERVMKELLGKEECVGVDRMTVSAGV